MTPKIIAWSFGAAALVVLAVQPRPVESASPVNLSHFVVHRSVTTGNSMYDLVPFAQVQDLCADEDGCTVTLKKETSDGSIFEVAQVQVFYSLPFIKWKTTAGLSGMDAAAGAQTVLSTGGGSSLCFLSDGDGATDSVFGFSVYTEAAGGVDTTCECVIAD